MIGITAADLYNPEQAWGYAFSNRRPPRFAVVSPARMDRGCLGIVRVNDERRLLRLRKMIGKNIGVLYYQLPLSTNPRSLLYGSIGGPRNSIR